MQNKQTRKKTPLTLKYYNLESTYMVMVNKLIKKYYFVCLGKPLFGEKREKKKFKYKKRHGLLIH